METPANFTHTQLSLISSSFVYETEQKPPEIPCFAPFIFHWALINKQKLPKALIDRIMVIKKIRLEIADKNPNDADNWLVLSQVEQFLFNKKKCQKYLARAQECDITSISIEKTNKLMVQLLHQSISFNLWIQKYDWAYTLIENLFSSPEGGTSEDFALRSACEIHYAEALPDDLINVISCYEKALYYLKSAEPMNPPAAEVLLKIVSKKLRSIRINLNRQKEIAAKILPSIYSFDNPVFNSIVVLVNLVTGFNLPMSICLPSIASKLQNKFNGKTLTIGSLENGSCFWLVCKILSGSLNVNSFKIRQGRFIHLTKMTLIPGLEIITRSQASILYAISCRGESGKIWANRLDKGICFGGATEWLIQTLHGNGDYYFDLLDKIVRQDWDDHVYQLFKYMLIFQYSPLRGIEYWHEGTGLELWKACEVRCNQDFLIKYLTRFSHQTFGILCIGGESDKRHAVAAVIHPTDEKGIRKSVFALFYDFNNEEGDYIADNVEQVADYLISAFNSSNTPITIRLYKKT